MEAVGAGRTSWIQVELATCGDDWLTALLSRQRDTPKQHKAMFEAMFDVLK